MLASNVLLVLGVLTSFASADKPSRGAFSSSWPNLIRWTSDPPGHAAVASVPLGRDDPLFFTQALEHGAMHLGEHTVQGQPVAWWDAEKTHPRRMVLRWIADEMPATIASDPRRQESPSENAGWSFSYRLLEGNTAADSIPWQWALRNVPLEQTDYEMYQLDLSNQQKRVGLRLGARHEDRIYWWQFVRADWISRGPVCDIVRAGGPIYNGETTIHSSVYLVLYNNGVIEAYSNFVNNMREGMGRDFSGIPVIAFDVPGAVEVNHILDGSQSVFDLGSVTINMGSSANFADEEFPASLKIENSVVVWQPWQDQQIRDKFLIERDEVPETHKKHAPTEGGHDTYWVTKIGDATIPKGAARSVRFTLSLSAAPAQVTRYQAPGWWHAITGNLPTSSRLPVVWWAMRNALDRTRYGYFLKTPKVAPFEYGRHNEDHDGTLAAGMSLLGWAADSTMYLSKSLPPAYWHADLAIDHVNYRGRELNYFSWQWIVPPYHRWIELPYAYWTTSDPYLLDVAQFAADSWYAFVKTNRPHRHFGRDALAVADMLTLYETTAQRIYLARSREMLALVRDSYDQWDIYRPGHQAGAGTNGVGRSEDYDYIPSLLARLHVQLLETGAEKIPQSEQEESWRFIKRMAELVRDRRGNGWLEHRVNLQYVVLTALADRYPDEASEWIELLKEYNQEVGMSERKSGSKAYSFALSALKFDSWAWGATWSRGELLVSPHMDLLNSPGAPDTAVVSTPDGSVTLRVVADAVEVVGDPPCRVRISPK